jgi:hypothetical protein
MIFSNSDRPYGLKKNANHVDTNRKPRWGYVNDSKINRPCWCSWLPAFGFHQQASHAMFIFRNCRCPHRSPNHEHRQWHHSAPLLVFVAAFGRVSPTSKLRMLLRCIFFALRSAAAEKQLRCIFFAPDFYRDLRFMYLQMASASFTPSLYSFAPFALYFFCARFLSGFAVYVFVLIPENLFQA